MYKDSLEVGIYLLHGYFVFLLECFNKFMSVEDREKIKNFFWKFSNSFGEICPTFIPDKININLSLKFRNIGLLTPTNVDKLVRDNSEYLRNS